MSERQDTLQQYVSDMLAVERHILEPIERQASDHRMKKHPEANDIVNRLGSVLKQHIASLEQHLKALGGDAAGPMKKTVTAVAGMMAGMYDKVRTDTISKALRDDYTALSLAAISYTMLYTTGSALNDQKTMALADRHLRDLTPIIVDISEVIPLVVAREISDEGEMVDTSVGPQAVQATQKAWSREAIKK